jgi:hypothetical protein
MNLIGDLRYVAPEEFAAYARDESPAERNAARDRFRANAERDLAEAEVDARFAAEYPPGFFGHRAAFRSDGALGRWLLERPVLLVRDRTAFVHGGLSAGAADGGESEINREYGAELRDYVAAVEVLTAAGALHAEDLFASHAPLAARFVERAESAGRPVPEPIRLAAARVAAFPRSALFGPQSLYWYRGTAACSAAIESDRVSRALRALGADRVVIGHTPTASARIESRFGETVIRADTGMLATHFGGRAAAVVIEGDTLRALYTDRPGVAPIEPQPRTVNAARIDDAALEALLRQAPIAARAAAGGATESLQLVQGGVTVAAIFTPAERARGGVLFAPEVAAYRLDRLLDFDLVPPAVLREIDGRVGSVTVDLGEWPDERARAAAGQADALCPLEDQIELMYAFDILVHNEGRRLEDMRYSPGLQLALTDNRRLFGAQTRDRPAYLRTAEPELSPLAVTRLRALTPELLAERFGDVLDENRRSALLERRDRLLEAARID